ncbi:MAG: hypothetical protein ACXABD_21975 [Candidatus Thorarchaeota archaeon]|jgi:hypothetical protein
MRKIGDSYEYDVLVTNIQSLVDGHPGGFAIPLSKKGEFKNWPHLPELYRVKGVAPTYTNHLIGGVFENLTMNWWVFRRKIMPLDYETVLGRKYDYEEDRGALIAANQLFLLREAEMFKEWIDEVYPEENTEIIKVDYPITDVIPYIAYWNVDAKAGSFWSQPHDWLYDLAVCYYIDTNNVKVRAT